MAVEINITRKLDNNHVQVEVNSKNIPTRYFKVESQKADEFCKAYKKYDKEQNIWSPIRVLTPVVLVTSIANHLTRNLNKAGQWGAAIGSGILAAAGAIRLNTKLLMKKEDNMLKQYNASEFDKDEQKLSFLKKAK